VHFYFKRVLRFRGASSRRDETLATTAGSRGLMDLKGVCWGGQRLGVCDRIFSRHVAMYRKEIDACFVIGRGWGSIHVPCPTPSSLTSAKRKRKKEQDTLPCLMRKRRETRPGASSDLRVLKYKSFLIVWSISRFCWAPGVFNSSSGQVWSKARIDREKGEKPKHFTREGASITRGPRGVRR
jgi:hypothetical protein